MLKKRRQRYPLLHNHLPHSLAVGSIVIHWCPREKQGSLVSLPVVWTFPEVKPCFCSLWAASSFSLCGFGTAHIHHLLAEVPGAPAQLWGGVWAAPATGICCASWGIAWKLVLAQYGPLDCPDPAGTERNSLRVSHVLLPEENREVHTPSARAPRVPSYHSQPWWKGLGGKSCFPERRVKIRLWLLWRNVIFHSLKLKNKTETQQVLLS